MKYPLEGQRALITGSARGIGHAIAQGLAAAGADVIINARSEATARHAAGEIDDQLLAAGRSPSTQTTVFDVTDIDGVSREVKRLIAEGPIDILVNNAGVQRRAPLTDLAVDDWRTVIDTNLTGAFIVGQAVGRNMVARKSGSIINICSVQSKVVRETTAAYAASKAGLVGLTQAMCAEWARSGVRTNALAPGYFDTEMNAALVADQTFSGWIRKRTPAGRWGELDELIGPAVWLASEQSQFVNGQVIYVDGGMTSVI